MRRFSLFLLGAGTVGYWTAKAFSRAASERGAARLVIADRARIRPVNAVTCPEYAGHAGRLKCERLAELAAEWFRGAAGMAAVPGHVEDLDWPGLMKEDAAAGRESVAIVGLDDWNGRLAACAGLRAATAERPGQAVLLQLGLDRGQAGVAVLGTKWSDPCPACGLSFLPGTEPCVALGEDGAPARGDLQTEAGAAARCAVRASQAFLAGRTEWVNTKTSFFRRNGARGFRRLTRPARRAHGCLGPHGPAQPMRWDGILEPLMIPAAYQPAGAGGACSNSMQKRGLRLSQRRAQRGSSGMPA